jgi:hypothetical protein
VNRSESIVASIWYPQETPSLCGGTQATGGGIVLISSKEVAHVPLAKVSPLDLEIIQSQFLCNCSPCHSKHPPPRVPLLITGCVPRTW